MIEYWSENSLPPSLLKKGVEFIRRCFLEAWGIYRIEVTLASVLKRKNLILFDDSKIIGWLGIEADGELTNACIEKGYKGVDRLVELIKIAYQVSPLDYLYAYVPICRTASARAFLKSGMKLEQKIQLTKLTYPERDIILAKLSIDRNKNQREEVNHVSIEANLEKIRRLNDDRYIQIHHRIIQEQL